MTRWTSLAFACLLVACSQNADEIVEAVEVTETIVSDPIVGGDRSEEGCIGSAGYQWSAVEEACVRVWEVGVELTHQGSGDPNFSAFAITNAEQAEIFLPEQSGIVILGRDDTAEEVVSWSNEAFDLRLTFDPENAMILTDLGGFVMYKEDILPAPTFDDIPDHASDEIGGEYAMDQGVVTRIEDGVYPMFTLHIQLQDETEPKQFALMAEGATISGGELYELTGKSIQFDYVVREFWDLISISSSEVDAFDPETKGNDWRFVIGRLQDAGEISVGDLPDRPSISTMSGERFEFEAYIDEAMVALNDKDVAAWLAPRATNEILSVTVMPAANE